MARKSLIALMALGLLLTTSSIALALQDPVGGNPDLGGKGNIVANQYDKVKGVFNKNGNGDYRDWVQEDLSGYNYPDSNNKSTHIQGTWNSPFTLGVDGYNYNDPQDYVGEGEQVSINGKMTFRSGPHGGYVTSTHRCRECHAVHRAAGKFKLLRSDTRFESCDWCHGTGAGSGFNIQMDNNDAYTTEYNVGHTMGYGIDSGKWKAPDDTYPAFTPNYYMGGFTCFDCHSPHANPARMLGYKDDGTPAGLQHRSSIMEPFRYYGIVNPGHGWPSEAPGKVTDACGSNGCHKGSAYAQVPVYLSGSWLLLKNADREIASATSTVPSGILTGTLIPERNVDIKIGEEIPDIVTEPLYEFDTDTPYPVNKLPIDWNTPIGSANTENPLSGYNVRNSDVNSAYWSVNEFCTDCHDGNAGLHTVQAPLFSEDRALRGQEPTGTANNWKGSYDLAYGHDEQSRHCARQMKFNPENSEDFGPHCRNCHKGSSGCGRCHNESNPGQIFTDDPSIAADNNQDFESLASAKRGASTYNVWWTSTNFQAGILSDPNAAEKINNMVISYTGDHGSIRPGAFMFKKSRNVEWFAGWRESESAVPKDKIMAPLTAAASACDDNGFSWPHRTLGWKMLKDDLFGLDFIGPDGSEVARSAYIAGANDNDGIAELGESRMYDANGDGSIDPATETFAVHDIDSVCLDCHNPTVWNATGPSHADNTDPAVKADDYNDELLLRGLP